MKILAKYKKFFQQDGQTAVFFALLLPVLILFLFVVFDLGWLYLNKSRLQNAAEAAAIAGANQFCAESTEGYNSVMLVYDYDRELNKTIINSTAGVEQATSDSWKSNLVGNTTSDEDSWTKATVTMPVSKFLGESADAETIYYEVKLTE
ncbi:MAG: pilus assembly protein, partial [Selenomonadaceae bacterium]|nr:pilus assembly protein [Selenomonadaceae bacterium]